MPNTVPEPSADNLRDQVRPLVQRVSELERGQDALDRQLVDTDIRASQA